jgi:cytidyltransferase-like protein
MSDKKIGVILARLQPIHKGHIALIDKAFNENDEVHVFVGSADKFNKRNPIPISLRLQLVNDALDEIYTTGDRSRIHVVPLDDLDDESNNSHEWGFYLYSKVVTETECPNFTIYYSDGFEIITTWFPGFILRNNVSLSLLARNSVKNGISATSVRQMIMEGDDENLRKSVPTVVFNHRDTIKNLIELSEKVH